jgi:hypothetical protein
MFSTAVVEWSEEMSGECSFGVVEGEATSFWVALRRGVDLVTRVGDDFMGLSTAVWSAVMD